MYAKLIVYQKNPTTESLATKGPELVSYLQEQPSSTDTHIHWQLIADNLTPGKLTELLVCLDELGFCNEIAD